MAGTGRGRCANMAHAYIPTRRPAIALEFKTLLNTLQPLRGFVYAEVTLVERGASKALRIDLEPDQRCKRRCGCCGQPAPGYDTQPRRSWDFVPLWGLKVQLCYQPRRVSCPSCQSVCVEALPWSEGKHQASKALMVFLGRWAKLLSWKDVSLSFGVSWQMVYRSVAWLVSYGLAQRPLEGIQALGVDELHWGRGKKSGNFITLIYQIDAGCRRLLWVGQRRTARCLRQGLNHLGQKALAEVQYVCSDMWKPYLKVIATLLPQALNILDRYHITAHLNKALDQVRHHEASALRRGATGPSHPLKKMRWTLLKRGKRLRGRARERLRSLLRRPFQTGRAWLLKETFEHFWTYRSVPWALAFLDIWTTRAMRSRIEPMKKVARMLRAHKQLLGNYFQAKKQYTSAIVEGHNLKCGLVMRRAYGLRTYQALEVALYHNLGDLPMPTLTHRFW